MANQLRFKRGLAAGIPTGAQGEPLFTTDTNDLYIGTGSGNQRFQKYIASGTTSQLLLGDGSLLTMPIVLTSPANGQVLKYNGTSWVNDSTGGITGSGTQNEITYWTGATTIGSLSTATYPSLTELSYVKGVTSAIQTQLDAKQSTITLTTTGSSGSSTFVSNTLNVPTYTLAGLGGQPQLNGTGFVKATGTTISYDNSTYYLASNPNAYIALTNLSAGAGINYNNTTGVIASTITQYTDALARAAISLTTTGTSGAATYNNSTGILNIPQYQDVLTNPVTGTGNANELSYWTSSSQIGSLTTATYPSLTELSYVKGVTSAIQTQLNAKEPTITAGTSAQYYRGDKTFQTLNTTAVAEGTNLYFTESRVRDTVLTGLNLTGGGSITSTDSILQAFGKVQNQISALVGGVMYQSTWNASTNTPTLTSSVGVKGYYYIVSVAGSTNLDGITDWKIGDWAIFNGTTWDKVDNTDAVSSVNGFTGAVSLTTANISEVTNLYYTDTRARAAISLTTSGSSGAATYNSTTGVLNVPQYSPDLSGYVPTSRTLTINGTAFDLSANRSWSVGTVTSVAASAGTGISISGSPITSSGTLTITNTAPDQTVVLTAGTGISVSGTYPNFTITNSSPSSGGTVTSVAALTLGTTGTDLSSSVANSTTTPVITLNVPTASATNRGALSSADWSTFNSKQSAITLTTTGSSGSATFVSNTLNVPTYTLAGLGGISGSGTTNYIPKFTSSSAIGNSVIYESSSNIGIGTTSPDGKMDIAQAMTNGSTSAFTTPHLSLTATSTTDNTGFVGMTFATSDNANYGYSYGALRSSGGLGDLIWRQHYNSAQGTELMRLTYSGNLGLGVTPSAWDGSLVKAIQIADHGASISSFSTGNTSSKFAFVTNNAFYDSGGWKYATNGAFAQYRLANDNHQWLTAPSGTAGNTISFTQAMTLFATGNLGVGVGGSDAGYKLDVNGTGRFSGALTGTSATFSSSVTLSSGNLSVSSGYAFINGEGNGLLVESGTAATARTGFMKYPGFEGMLISGNSTKIRLAHRTDSDYVYGGTPTIREDLVIFPSGDVGIGMNPSYKLDVTGQARVSDAIAINTTPDTNFPFKILKAINSTVGLRFENTSTASLAFSGVQFGTDVSGGTAFTNIVYGSSGITESGVYKPNGTAIINTGSGGLNLLAVSQPIRFFTSSGTGTERVRITNDGDITQFNGTNPSASTTDAFRMYSADITAGNAAPHFRTEGGAVIKLYQLTPAIAVAARLGGGGTTVTDTDTFGGYKIGQIVEALQKVGILQ